MVLIRPATPEDLPSVDALIRTTSPETSPLPTEAYPDNFTANTRPEDVLVAATEGQVVGFIKLGHRTSLATNTHVLTIAGLGVSPAHQGRGMGRSLSLAAIQEAKARGARRLTLHALGTNRRALALYSSLGFVVEGVLHEEFLIDGQYVDDVLMALTLDD